MLFHLINQQWTNFSLDLFMAVISRSDIWTPVFVIVGCLLLIFGGFRGKAFVCCTALALGLSNCMVDPLKNVVARPRPKQAETVRMIELEKARPMILTIFKKPIIRLSTPAERSRSGASFPSGHTNNNTVIAVCCTIFYRRWGKLYWLITAAVGYSRVYLGAHWPSDVTGTIFLAVGETLLILAGCEIIWQKIVIPRLSEKMALSHPTLLGDRYATSSRAAQQSAPNDLREDAN